MKNLIVRINDLVKHILASFFVRLFGIIFIKRRKSKRFVLFESFDGAQYSDNPKAVSEKLHESNPNIVIVWHLIAPEKCLWYLPDYIIIVKTRLEFYKAMAESFCFVKNTQFSLENPKLKDQLFIQTWHGDRGFKKALFDSGKRYGLKICDNQVTDYCIAGSRFGEQNIRQLFRYSGTVLNIGSPKNDKLLNSKISEINQVRNTLGLDDETHVLLYAPTFRDNALGNHNMIVDVNRVLSLLNRRNQRWVCFVRAHIAARFDVPVSDSIRDVSNYPDMADLLLITDMLISDYSSCSCDFALCKKPIILAVFDEDDYEKNCRNFYVRPEDCGFIVAKNQNELESIICTTTEEDYKRSCERVNNYYGTLESGIASQSLCDIILMNR